MCPEELGVEYSALRGGANKDLAPVCLAVHGYAGKVGSKVERWVNGWAGGRSGCRCGIERESEAERYGSIRRRSHFTGLYTRLDDDFETIVSNWIGGCGGCVVLEQGRHRGTK